MIRKCFLICLLVLASSCSHGVDLKPKLRSHLFISYDELDRAGIDGVDPSNIHMLVENMVYLVSGRDCVVARFSKDGKAEKRYYAKGQGPGEFQKPYSVFRYDPATIAVFDLVKGALLFFDNDLNFEREVNLRKQSESRFRKITKSGGFLYAFGDFGDNYLALLDSDFSISRTFRKIPTVMPFKDVYKYELYMACLLNDGEIAATSWGYFFRNCKADIINAKTGQVKISLYWKSPISLTQADVTAMKNEYSCQHILKTGNRYVIETDFRKHLKAPPQWELIIFDDKGVLVARMKTPYNLIPTNEEHGSRIYFVDDKDNICYWKVGANWPWK